MRSNLPDLYRQIWKDASTIRLVVMTFVGIVIQAIIFLGTLWDSTIKATMTGVLDLPIQDFAVYFVINLATAFGYCLISSTAFYPKRIVAPHLVMIGASGLIAIMQLGIFLYRFPLPTIQIAAALIPATLYLMMLSMFAWLLTQALKKIIGLNGTAEDLAIECFSIGLSFENVRQLITNREFRHDNELEIEENDNQLVVLKSHRLSEVKITMALIPPDKKEHQYPILALSGYEVKYDSIRPTKAVQRRINRLKNDILGELGKDNPKFSMTQIDYDNYAKDAAVENALDVTSSPLTRIPRRITITVVGLLILGGLSYSLVYLDKIDLSTYIVLWISIASVIISLTVPALREGAKRNDEGD